MKTTISKYVMALALSPMLLSSCSSDFLNEVNPNEQTPATFWVSEENVMKGLSAVYNPFRRMTSGYYGGFNGVFHTEMRADDTYPTRGEEPDTWQLISFTNTPNTGNSAWGYIYQGIQIANEFIFNAPQVPMDKAKMDQLLGEAYFARGFWYFRLRCDFGEGVIRTAPQSQDGEARGLSSKEEVLEQAINDFKEAKARLPKSRPGDESGRVTKGAAIAMLGKALVWKGDYAQAKAEFESIMNGYNYDLMADYSHNFRDDTEFNEESIFEINYESFGRTNDCWGSSDQPDAFMGANVGHFFGPAVPGKKGGWYKMHPSPYLIQQFTAEKRPAGSDSKWDKRFYTTCFFKYSDYKDVKEDETFFGGVSFDDIFNQTCMPDKDNRYRITTGYSPAYPDVEGATGRFMMKKLTPWWSETGCGMYSNPSARLTNFRVMRFAEVLFLHAEACVETGDNAGAMKDINRIRQRAGLATKNLTDKTSITEELRNQKMLEFVAENVRWDDLVRWYSYDQLKQILLKRKTDSAHWTKQADGSFVKDADSFYPNGKLYDTQNYAGFQKKHMYFPIPQSEVDANLSLDQKAEWQ